MFGIEQNRLVGNLEKIRKRLLCAYGGHTFCDCKYGGEEDIPKGLLSETFSGCPEVSQAMAIISIMTPEEFDSFCKKAGVLL